MRKITIQFLAIFAIVAVMLSGCDALKKMVKQANLIQHKVTPNPLEMHADQVPVQINVTFPANFFNPKAYLVVTPIIKADDGSVERKLESRTIQGEKVKDNNPVIKYAEGGQYVYTDTIPYEEALRMSDLYIQVNASIGAKSVSFNTVKIGEGIITTPRLVDDGMLIDNGNNNDGSKGSAIGKTILESVSLPASSEESSNFTVFYPMQQSSLDAKEKKKEDIKNFIQKVSAEKTKNEKQLQAISIASYASPDGPVDMNQGLVDGRGKTAQTLLNDEFKKAKIDMTKDGNIIKRETTPAEDWDGFKKVTNDSKVKDKEVILRVLSMYSDPIVREREIKNISEAYTELKTAVLPQLRRAEVKAIYSTKAKSKEELVNLGANNPNSLKQVELFYAAQEADNSKKEAIYKNYISKYADDYKAHNNLGVYYLRNNNLAAAETSLLQADKLQPNNGNIYNNLGVLYYAKKDYKKAEEYFTKAKSLGNNEAVGYNLGVIKIKQAKYKEAVQNFGSASSFNKALAQLCGGEPNAAATTLKGVNSDHPKFFYLKAIVASRNANTDEMYNNLRTAVGKDASLKEYAKKDAEFIKYINDDTFKAIVN